MKTRGPCKLKVTNQINTTGKKIPTGRRAFSMIQWVGDLPSTVVDTKDKSSWKLTKRGFESGEFVFQFSTLNDTIMLLIKPTEKKTQFDTEYKMSQQNWRLCYLFFLQKDQLLSCSGKRYFSFNVLRHCGRHNYTSGIFLITCFSYCSTEFDQIHRWLQNSTLNNVFLGFCGCGFDNRSHPVAMKKCAFFVP